MRVDTGTIAANVRRARAMIEAACRRSGRQPGGVTIIAVTKGFGPEAARSVAAAGVKNIGENRVQEALPKIAQLQDLPLTWHMIGHLQTNKVNSVLEHFDMIHSVDSLHLAEAISARAQTRVPIFIEVNVAEEATKSGFAPIDLPAAFERIRSLPRLDVRGLMTVAPPAPDPNDVRPVFRRLRAEADHLGLADLSMGMSDDFEVAVEEGATHVRLGRALFGERPAP